ncbi:MAG: sigma-54 dependent transcriptional regulator [Thermodesulfovibrionales bacterium]|nr:sigma-54 dependent transcriptional regulator [Thermodesulfovibrionales bacterium]
MSETKILIVDDEKLLRWSLQQSLSKDGYTVFTAETGSEGLKIFKEELPDIVLLDINLPDVSGVNVLEQIMEINRDAIVFMITAYSDVPTAVKTVKLGAYDFIEKPFNMDKLNILIAKAAETVSLRKDVSTYRHILSERYNFSSIIGESAEIKKVIEIAKKIAYSDATTILLHGESGTGKDLLAKVIHYQSKRADKPFLEINCTALPESLIESELFGYEKGAFTDAKSTKKGLFELADGGTVYLDEIGDMKLGTQTKLLKVLENKTFKRIGGVRDITVDVRIIAATNKNLEEAIKEGSFREDLYYRLNVIPVRLPPLRERDKDVLVLARYFIEHYNREFKKNVKGIHPVVEEKFLNYHWPGNVRELKNLIERIMILESGDIILPEYLPCEINPAYSKENKNSFFIRLPESGIDIEEVEKELIRQALERTGNNQTKAAKLLNLSRDALRYRMQKFGFL